MASPLAAGSARPTQAVPANLPTAAATVAAFEAQYRYASRPDRDPELAAGEAEDQQLNLIYYNQQLVGRWEQASAAYRVILDGDGSQAAKREALWRLGQCNLAGQSYARAIALYQQFQDAYPADERSARLDYLIADAYNYLADYPHAVEYYTRYLDGSGPLYSFTLLRIAEASLAAGNLPAAGDRYAQAASRPQSSLAEQQEARDGLAQVAEQRRDYSGAVATYQQLISDTTNVTYRAEMEYRLANVQSAGGDPLNAARHYLALLAEPDSPLAYNALQKLLAIRPDALTDGTLDYYRAGRAAYAGGAWQVAINNLRVYLAPEVAGPERANALLYAGLSYERLGNDERAAANYRTLLADHPAAPAASAAHTRLGRLAEAQGNCESAINDYAAAGDLAAAAGSEAAFHLGLCQFKRGAYGLADKAWQPLTAALVPTATRAAALYWRGRAMEALGQDGSSFYAQAASLPIPYYAARATAQLDRIAPTMQQASGDLARLQSGLASEQPYLAATAQWLTTVQPTATLHASDLPAYAEDMGVQRTVQLLRLGERIYAYRELTRSTLAGLVERRDYATLTSLALYARYRDEPYVGLIVAERLAEIAPASVLPLPLLLERTRYPTSFAAAVLAGANDAAVDPLLLYAVMWQESRFNPLARSGADARGLMQVVPSTAAEIARNLGDSGFNSSDLYRPLVAARYGALYLADRLRAEGGSVIRAAAGYNAGGGSLAQWSGGPAANDVDLFTENISYAETAEYVRIVYANYVAYRRIYAQGE